MAQTDMNEIDSTAAEWAARVDGASPGPEVEAALDAWLAADARHVGAFARAQAMLVAFETAATDIVHAPVLPRPGRPNRRALLWGGGMAAGLAALGVGGVWLVSADTAYATALGERRTIPLKDGGELTLNTSSRVGVRDGKDHCRITFLQGEILVRSGTGKTTVRCEDAILSCMNSAFDLRRQADGAILTVFSGQVSVSGMKAALGPGGRLRLTSDGAVALPALDSDGLERSLAWRNGRIALENATLTEAVAEFARYTTTDIRIEGENVGAKRVSGLFAANDPAGFAEAVSVTSGLKTETRDGRIYLSEPRN